MRAGRRARAPVILASFVEATAAAMHDGQKIGLHLDHATEADDAVRDVEAVGGTIIERGDAPGVPFARIADPDGNVLEI